MYMHSLLQLVMLLGFAGFELWQVGPSEMVGPDMKCQKIMTNYEIQNPMTYR